MYRPNRPAREGEDQAALIECWGQRCTVEQAVVHHDGTAHAITAAGAFQQGTRPMHTFRVSKKAAGRLLDGRLHNEFPEAR